MKAHDLTGQRFGRLTVSRRVKNNSLNKTRWLCLCDCGNEHVVLTASLLRGNTRSCGCIQAEISRRHLSATASFRIWWGMHQRCKNPNLEAFKWYGGRGITVDPRWNRFENFYMDMGDRPDGMSIERKDNNGNYSPENCVWATPEQQMSNTRRNRLLKMQGETKTLTRWAREYGLSPSGLVNRLRRGWPVEEAITTPPNRNPTREERRGANVA